MRWRVICSRFEADWVYLENARRSWPRDDRGINQRWKIHWVVLDPQAPHPIFTASQQPQGPPKLCFGPLGSAQQARALVELLEDLFDLCRYPHILRQAPHGQACAYKQMDRCPAPCDGSIPMAQYRGQIEQAVRFLTQPRELWAQQIAQQMRRAADGREFEQAARFKRLLDRSKAADAPALAHVRLLESFRYLAFFRGDGKNKLRPFLILPGVIESLGEVSLKSLDAACAALAKTAPGAVFCLDGPGAQRLSLASWHLMYGKPAAGLFVPLTQAADAQSLACAIRQWPSVSQPQEPTDVQPLESHG